MNRIEFEKKYVGNCVRIVLFDDTELIGYLFRTDTEDLKNKPNLYFMKKYYYIGDAFKHDTYNLVFKKSHIKSIRPCRTLQFT